MNGGTYLNFDSAAKAFAWRLSDPGHESKLEAEAAMALFEYVRDAGGAQYGSKHAVVRMMDENARLIAAWMSLAPQDHVALKVQPNRTLWRPVESLEEGLETDRGWKRLVNGNGRNKPPIAWHVQQADQIIRAVFKFDGQRFG